MKKNYEKMVLYGAGYNGQKFYYSFKDRDQISYVIDNYKTYFNERLHVYRLEDVCDELNKDIILVAAEWESYIAIKENLKKRGLVEFYDFLPAEAYDKKIAVLHGNCYMDAYGEYLHNSRAFCDKYYIYKVKQIHLNTEKKLDDNLLRNCDLFIYQDIKNDNPYSSELADSAILPKLKRDCRKIIVPNLVGYGKCYYPYCSNEHNGNPLKSAPYNLFLKNEAIDYAYKKCKGFSIDDILCEYMNYGEKKEESIFREFDIVINKIKKRELNWSIKVSDYFLLNYQSQKIFMDLYHIGYEFMLFICQQLGEILQLEDAFETIIQKKYDETEEMVHPSVRKALGISWRETYIRLSEGKDNKLNSKKNMDTREYICQYIYWWYGDSIDN